MKQVNLRILIISILMFGIMSQLFAGAEESDGPPQIPTPDQVTMVDLGAHKCIPCKMMAPIIAELQKEYSGRASVIFIDVWENPDEAKKYGIRAIPTQIFYDKTGKEAGRHTGYLDKKSIVSALEQLGVPTENGQ